jgi:hypothetical protein
MPWNFNEAPQLAVSENLRQIKFIAKTQAPSLSPQRLASVCQATRGALPLRWSGAAYIGVLLVHQFGTAQPALRQTVPNSFVLRIASELSHDLAFGRKSQEPIRRMNHVEPLELRHQITNIGRTPDPCGGSDARKNFGIANFGTVRAGREFPRGLSAMQPLRARELKPV